MAVTPNSKVTEQTPTTIVGQVATSDQTTASAMGTATTNGRKIFKVLVFPGASDREIGFWDYDGSNAREVCLVDITADAAADIVPVDILANVPLPVDENGNKYYPLAAGHTVYMSGEDVAQTNDVSIPCWDY